MPIPFLVAGAIAVTGVLGAAAKSVNNDLQNELESIYDSMENLQEKVEKQYNRQENKMEAKKDELELLRKNVYEYSLKRFAEDMNKIKKIDLSERKNLQVAFKQSLAFSSTSFKRSYAPFMTGGQAAVKGAILGTLGGSLYFAGSVVKGVKMMNRIEEAEAEYERLKVEAKKIEAAAKQLKIITKQAEEIISVLSTLDYLFKHNLKELERVIDEEGVDFSKYSQESKETIFVGVKFAQIIQVLISAPLVTKEGKLEQQAKNAVEKANAFLSEVEGV